MKTNFIIIIAGIILFILGYFMATNNYYQNLLLNFDPNLSIILFLAMVSSGLIITGIGVMMEFASRKYEERN